MKKYIALSMLIFSITIVGSDVQQESKRQAAFQEGEQKELKAVSEASQKNKEECQALKTALAESCPVPDLAKKIVYQYLVKSQLRKNAEWMHPKTLFGTGTPLYCFNDEAGLFVAAKDRVYDAATGSTVAQLNNGEIVGSFAEMQLVCIAREIYHPSSSTHSHEIAYVSLRELLKSGQEICPVKPYITSEPLLATSIIDSTPTTVHCYRKGETLMAVFVEQKSSWPAGSNYADEWSLNVVDMASGKLEKSWKLSEEVLHVSVCENGERIVCQILDNGKTTLRVFDPSSNSNTYELELDAPKAGTVGTQAIVATLDANNKPTILIPTSEGCIVIDAMTGKQVESNFCKFKVENLYTSKCVVKKTCGEMCGAAIGHNWVDRSTLVMWKPDCDPVEYTYPGEFTDVAIADETTLVTAGKTDGNRTISTWKLEEAVAQDAEHVAPAEENKSA